MNAAQYSDAVPSRVATSRSVAKEEEEYSSSHEYEMLVLVHRRVAHARLPLTHASRGGQFSSLRESCCQSTPPIVSAGCGITGGRDARGSQIAVTDRHDD